MNIRAVFLALKGRKRIRENTGFRAFKAIIQVLTENIAFNPKHISHYTQRCIFSKKL